MAHHLVQKAAARPPYFNMSLCQMLMEALLSRMDVCYYCQKKKNKRPKNPNNKQTKTTTTLEQLRC